ncbi:Uncharacterised protein [uncultured archaeon]|nr:Uncharacterised protein [uncultured archaeon]
MEIRSFIAGILIAFAAFVLLPILKVNVTVTNPIGMWGNVVVAIVAVIVSYYLIRM